MGDGLWCGMCDVWCGVERIRRGKSVNRNEADTWCGDTSTLPPLQETVQRTEQQHKGGEVEFNGWLRLNRRLLFGSLLHAMLSPSSSSDKAAVTLAPVLLFLAPRRTSFLTPYSPFRTQTKQSRQGKHSLKSAALLVCLTPLSRRPRSATQTDTHGFFEATARTKYFEVSFALWLVRGRYTTTNLYKQ